MNAVARRWAAGLAVLALVGGGYYLGTQHSAREDRALPAATPGTPTALPSVAESIAPTPASAKVAHPLTGGERKRRDKIAADLTRAFDLEMVPYFKQVMDKSQGDKIEWYHRVSASPSLSEADREIHRNLWDKYLALCKEYRDLDVPYVPRMRLYLAFFDVKSFKPTAEQLAILPQAGEWDKVPLGYITEVINPAWYFDYRPIHTSCDFSTEQAKRDLPLHLRQLMASEESAVPPTSGIKHLEGYEKKRADDFGGDTLRAIAKHMSVKGKDWADLGAGCGFTLPLFRQAIGPKAKLWAGELDVYTRDVLEYTSRGTNAVIFRNYQDDCNCGENAFDIINMTGVHMGIMCVPQEESNIENHFLPWIRSMNKALRPGGLLVIHDGNWDLVDRQVDKLVEKAGFKKIDQVECHEHSAFIWIFRVEK